MKKAKVFKNAKSHETMLKWYRTFMEALPYEVQEETIKTSFGSTEIVLTGPSEGVPILILHGAMAGAPFALGELCAVPEQRRMIAINIFGQSPVADQIRLDFHSAEYSNWICEVLDQLDIQQVLVAGVSWGGSVALQLAKSNPERISGMVLVVPGSIVKGSALRGFFDVGLPMLKYQIFPTELNRDKAFRNVLTSNDPLWNPYLGDAVRNYNTDLNVPPLIKEEDLKQFEAPVYVIAADRDVFFPGDQLLQRSDQLFKNLVGKHLLADSHHSPSFSAEGRKEFSELFENAIQLVS